MAKKFCIYPLTTLNMTAPELVPCCMSSLDESIRSMLIADPADDMGKVWNSVWWTWWRGKIADDDYELCGRCGQKADWVTEDELFAEYPDMAGAIMEYRKGNRSALQYPHTLILSYDHTCNLRCTTCRPADGSIRREEIGKIHANVMNNLNKVSRIIIAGDGEVAMSKYYREVLENIRKPVKITVMSNGTRLNMDFWASLPPGTIECIDRIHISCDGTTKEIYEAIRLNGNFDDWCANMELLRDMKMARNWHTKLMYTVSKVNYGNFREGDFRKVPEFARKYGFDEIFINPAAKWNRPIAASAYWETDQALPEPQIRMVNIAAERIMAEYNAPKV